MERHHFSVLEQKCLYRGQKVCTQSQDWNIKLCTLFQKLHSIRNSENMCFEGWGREQNAEATQHGILLICISLRDGA